MLALIKQKQVTTISTADCYLCQLFWFNTAQLNYTVLLVVISIR